jgi:stage V sporulation protein G
MQVTSVDIKLETTDSGATERLLAYVHVTFDDSFVMRDIKIIDGQNGVFVAMPSRKLADHCPECNTRNHLRARYCNHCGGRLDETRAIPDGYDRARLHADVAHPINRQAREQLTRAVMDAYFAAMDAKPLRRGKAVHAA